MDTELIDKLCRLIKQMTETGEWSLDKSQLKNVKSTCKRSEEYVQVAFSQVMSQLRKKHSQIRYSSLQLIEQLFERSKIFRDLLTEDFPDFVQLVVGVPDEVLPPPSKIAIKLKQYGLSLVKKWHLHFGERYPAISFSFHFLLDHGIMPQDISLPVHPIPKANPSARIRAIQLNRYELLKADMDDHIEIVHDNLKTMQGCFDILVPKNEMNHEGLDFEALLRGELAIPSKHQDAKKDILSHGLGSSRYQLTIHLSEDSMMDDLKETQENQVLFDQLRESLTVLQSKHTPEIQHWLQTLTKMELADRHEKETRIKRLIDLKSLAKEASRKARMLGIKPLEPKTDGLEAIEDEFENEPFEEVDIQAQVRERKQKASVPPLQRLFPLSSEPEMKEDPTYTAPVQPTEKPQAKEKGKQRADTKREELLKKAPFVEWGDDLYYWDKDHVQFNTSGIERSHRFMGTGEGTNEMPGHLLDELRKRPVYYPSHRPKEIAACGHPLHDGGLCPRQDLVTCPFHGKIVPRDELGRPLSSEVPNPVPHQAPATQHAMDNLWELLESDVMAQSGQQPIAPRGQKRKQTALIDIKKVPDTSYTRLDRKMNTAKNRKNIQEADQYERLMKSQAKASSWR